MFTVFDPVLVSSSHHFNFVVIDVIVGNVSVVPFPCCGFHPMFSLSSVPDGLTLVCISLSLCSYLPRALF